MAMGIIVILLLVIVLILLHKSRKHYAQKAQ